MDAAALIRQLLEKRGIAPDQQAAFLQPDFERDLYDPLLMKGMEAAVARLLAARASGERVVIFGDYDADGVPATALLVRGLRRLGLDPTPLIPLREDGYGLTPVALEKVRALQPKLLITVDNGSVAKAEIAALQAEGIDVIVLDHHEAPPEHFADAAFALINPKQAGCTYPFKELCGCGLAWKFLLAAYRAAGENEGALKWLLDLVALSTVADMVPLVGENRVLVHYGLQVVHRSRNLGFVALAEVAGITLSELSAGDLGFKIAPRINAPSRMHREVERGVHRALELLITEDAKRAKTLAAELNALNGERQLLLDSHLAEAMSQADAQLAAETDTACCLVVYAPDWSSGVIGLVASRLVDKYRRPAIVLASEGEEIKGSVRSLGEVHVVELLESCDELLLRYGGHHKAGGLTLKPGVEVAQLRDAANQYMRLQGIDAVGLETSALRLPDLDLTLADATTELAQALQALAPFGLGFAEPRFATVAALANPRRVGRDGAHLSTLLEDGGLRRKAIGFRLGEQEVSPSTPYRIIFILTLETWNGSTSPSCVIERIEILP